MYLAASIKNEVNCIGSDSCKYSQINCGIPDNIPSVYSLSDFDGHINECSVYLSKNAISDSSSIKCFHDIDECKVYAQTDNDDFKESTFVCELSPKNSLCSIDCFNEKACGSKTSRFFCNAPNCACNGNGCSGLRKNSQDTAPPSTSILGETVNPTLSPSLQPTKYPTYVTKEPTAIPTNIPTKNPTTNPSVSPTQFPSTMPSSSPSQSPSQSTLTPTLVPSHYPSMNPLLKPTSEPTEASTSPTMYPTRIPTEMPAIQPNIYLTEEPTINPTLQPKENSENPTQNPTSVPSLQPTINPTEKSDKVTIDYTITIEIGCDGSDSDDSDCIDKTEITNIVLNALSAYYNVTITNMVLDDDEIIIKLSIQTDANQIPQKDVIEKQIEDEFENQPYGTVEVNVSFKDTNTASTTQKDNLFSEITSNTIIIILFFAIILLCCAYAAYFYGKHKAKKEIEKENSIGIAKIFRFSEVDKADKDVQIAEDGHIDGHELELTVPKLSVKSSNASDLESIASIKQLPLSPANESDEDLEAFENVETIQIDINEDEQDADGDDETDSSKMYATDNNALTISPGEDLIVDGGNKTTIDNAVNNALMPPSNLKLIDMDSDDAVLATPGSLEDESSSDDDVNLNSAGDLEGSYNHYE